MAEKIILVLLFGLAFWIWMLADCINHERRTFDKSIWIAIIILLNVDGAFAYLVLRHSTNRRSHLTSETVSFQNDYATPLICPWCDSTSSAVKVEAQESSSASPMHQICPGCFDKFNKRRVSA